MSENKKFLAEQNQHYLSPYSKNNSYLNKKREGNNIYFNESVNLNQVNQKIKLEKQKFNSFHNKQKNSEEELLVQAFDPEEDFPLPENYIIDELNEESINFLKKAKEEEKFIELKKKQTQLKAEKNLIENQSTTILSDKENKLRNHQIVQKEEIIYNINVNNRDIFAKNYTDFNISTEWKNIILHEFNYLNKYFSEIKANKNNYSLETYLTAEEQRDYHSYFHLSNLNKMNKQILSHDDIIKEFKLYRENINFIKAPVSDNMSLFLALKINNKNAIRLIKHFWKNLSEAHNVYNILMWIYMLLSFLQMPLVDDDNSILYGLNKSVKKFIEMSIEIEKQNIDNMSEQSRYKNDEQQVNGLKCNNEHQLNYDLIGAKIIYIILSEFFNQRIIL